MLVFFWESGKDKQPSESKGERGNKRKVDMASLRTPRSDLLEGKTTAGESASSGTHLCRSSFIRLSHMVQRFREEL